MRKLTRIPRSIGLVGLCAGILLAPAPQAVAKNQRHISAPASRSALLKRFHDSAAFKKFLKTTRAGAGAAAHYARSADAGGTSGKCVELPIMSSAGQLAARAVAASSAGGSHIVPLNDEWDDREDEEGFTEGPAGGQAEVSIAVDSTGSHVVIGFNDTRGFAIAPNNLSGYFYSDDGGVTFTDGGQVQVTTGSGEVATNLTPAVFGDPEVKYAGGGNFYYFSILVRRVVSTSGTTVQTMCMHRSTDFGHTWKGPFEVTAATRPHALAGEAADKEFADVDPETGRVLVSWSNFTSTGFAPGGVEIRATFSDNALLGTPPTWSASAILGATAADGQASIPRFAGNGSPNAYVAWRRFTTSFSGGGQNVGFAKSTDNGATWAAAVNLFAADYWTMDQVLGNDRVNTSPGLDVDVTSGATTGNLYVVVANNDNLDGADISYIRSTDSGSTWSTPILLDSRPGVDRPQWFPWANVDKTTGRVYAFYYDQQIAATGDLMEAQYQYSDDGGVTWHKPTPLSARPFHAGHGNDTGQPNLGDYIQAVAQGGELFASFAITEPKGFTDGQPSSASMTTPDVYFKRISTAPAPLSLGTVSYTDTGSNGFIDAGEHALLTLPLVNYVTNGINASTVTGISGVLSTTTTGVTISSGNSAYPNIAAGGNANNTSFFDIFVDASTFSAGSDIELVLTVASSEGNAALPFTLHTGTPVLQSTLINETFTVAPGTLPAGWSTLHGGGTTTVPWTTNDTFMGTGSNAAFHVNANDAANPTRFERLLSPVFAVPASSRYVTVDYDTVYDTEDDLYAYGSGRHFNVQAYDGYTLRVTDQTAGNLLRSVLAEAFETEMYTGSAQHQPKHLPRNSSTAYFQDMSVWAGYSNGVVPIHMRLPGMQGTSAQLRFEFTQDSGGICTDVGHPAQSVANACGVAFDNLLVRSYILATQTQLAVGSPSGQYSDSVNLTATVSPNVTSAGTATGSVAFTVNGNPVGSAPINASGVATLPYTILEAAGGYPIGATFTSTHAGFLGSTGAGTLTVSVEDAKATPSAANAAWIQVPGANLNSGAFTLSANITEVADGSLGNICNAVITVQLNPFFGGTAYGDLAPVINSCDGTTLSITANFNGIARDVYQVTYLISGNYYAGSWNALLTVADPAAGFQTGGGRFLHTGIPSEFGFQFKRRFNSLSTERFKYVYLEHRNAGDVYVTANNGTLTAVQTATSAIFSGTATANSVAGSPYKVVATNGAPDKLAQQVKTPGNVIVPALTFEAIPLTAGNILTFP